MIDTLFWERILPCAGELRYNLCGVKPMQTPTTETPSVEQLYEEQIRSLTPEQKLRLIALIASELAEGLPQRPKRSIMELHGLGAEIWQGIDAQEYVDQLRSEWDTKP
jgi:hypothetical protein